MTPAKIFIYIWIDLFDSKPHANSVCICNCCFSFQLVNQTNQTTDIVCHTWAFKAKKEKKENLKKNNLKGHKQNNEVKQVHLTINWFFETFEGQKCASCCSMSLCSFHHHSEPPNPAWHVEGVKELKKTMFSAGLFICHWNYSVDAHSGVILSLSANDHKYVHKYVSVHQYNNHTAMTNYFRNAVGKLLHFIKL